MTRKELILRMIEKLPDDVTYDRVIYHLDVMKNVEISLAEVGRGELIDHEDVFAELSAESGRSSEACSRAEDAMKYKVILQESEEGFAASVPGLPGCHSQGATEQEALANITDAIREYWEVARELPQEGRVREVEVEA